MWPRAHLAALAVLAASSAGACLPGYQGIDDTPPPPCEGDYCPPFSVSGVVTGGVGVTVTVQELYGYCLSPGGCWAGSTTTDASGQYRVGGLPVRSLYTVTPAGAGLTFDPGSRQVDLRTPSSILAPGETDVSGQDFLAVGTP